MTLLAGVRGQHRKPVSLENTDQLVRFRRGIIHN